MKKIRVFIIIFIIIIIGVLGFNKLNKKDTTDYSNYPVTDIKEGQFIVTIEEVGVIKAVKTISIYSPFRGKISDMIDDGTEVKEGQTVIWLDTQDIEKEVDNKLSDLLSRRQDLEARIESLEMGIRNNTLDVESAKAELEFAKLKLTEVERDLDTKKELLEAEIISRTDIKEAEMDYHSSKLDKDKNEYAYVRTEKSKESDEKVKNVQINDVNVKIGQSEKDLNKAKDKLNQAEIKAPAAGLFLVNSHFDHHSGQIESVKAGDSIRERQMLGSIPDLSDLIVKSQIGESDVFKINKGTPVEMDVDAFPDLKLTGKVENIGALAIQRFASEGAGIVSSNVEFFDQKVFEVTLSLDKSDERLKPGMTVNISYIIDKLKDVKYLATKAVFNDKGKRYIYEVNGKEYNKIEVQTDKKNRTDVVILSDLPKGTKVFTKKPKENEEKSTGKEQEYSNSSKMVPGPPPRPR